jgi:hypothetical protein
MKPFHDDTRSKPRNPAHDAFADYHSDCRPLEELTPTELIAKLKEIEK